MNDCGCEIAIDSKSRTRVLMMVAGAAALLANVVCLLLTHRHSDAAVHRRASWMFSKHDLITRMGVIEGAGSVWLPLRRWPDLPIGGLIGLLILHGARPIIADARRELTGERMVFSHG